jgi:phosphatidylserine/phosphatidylglycerophosphate/cardiolipin synthase-like enzyme
MKKLLIVFLALFLLCVFVGVPTGEVPPSPATTATTTQAQPSITCYFSPNGGAQQAILDAIKSAKESINILAFQFSNVPIADELIRAYKCGVKVEIVLDKYTKYEKGSMLSAVHRAGIPTYIDSKHTSAHNKVMIVDEAVLITGSFNFTYNAEYRNAENLLVVRNAPDITSKYIINFLVHKGHADRYK